MKNFDVKIFESRISDESFNKIKEELNKNPKFQINDDNITEFVDCKLILDILEEHKIEYKIIANDKWTTSGRLPQYDLILCIYISQKDYVLIKNLLEPEKVVEDDEYNGENDKITKSIKLMYNIFINVICFGIGALLIILGIQIINEDITMAIILMIVGGGIVIFRIAKIIMNKKRT